MGKGCKDDGGEVENDRTELHYLPPHMDDGTVKGAALVSEGEVVEASSVEETNKEVNSNEEEPVQGSVVIEEERVGSEEQSLVEEVEQPSVEVEGKGEVQG